LSQFINTTILLNKLLIAFRWYITANIYLSRIL